MTGGGNTNDDDNCTITLDFETQRGVFGMTKHDNKLFGLSSIAIASPETFGVVYPGSIILSQLLSILMRVVCSSAPILESDVCL